MKVNKLILPILLISSIAKGGFWDWLKYENFARPKVALALTAIGTAAYKLSIVDTISSAASAAKSYFAASNLSKVASDLTKTIDIKTSASVAGEVVKESSFNTSVASLGVTALAVVGSYYGIKYLSSKCWDFLFTNRDDNKVVQETTTTTTATTTATTGAK